MNVDVFHLSSLISFIPTSNMSNPFRAPDEPLPEKSSIPSTNSNPFEPPSSPPPGQASSSSQSFASPPGVPPNRPGGSTGKSSVPPSQPDPTDVAVPDEPPPAYSSGPGANTIASGPSRMDFSGPPPLPDRFQSYDRPQIEQQITGVGYGYRPDPELTTQYTGFAPPPASPPRKSGFAGGDGTNDQKPMNTEPTGGSSAGPSRSAPDLSPTEVATPGRPLLRKGQLLVYPKNHYCQKCTQLLLSL